MVPEGSIRCVMTTDEDVAKMAALAVRAELKFRDGLREKISVAAENNLSSLLHAVHALNGSVSRLLSELVEREKPHGGCAAGELSPDNITAQPVRFLSFAGSFVVYLRFLAAGDEEESDEEDEEPEDPVNSDRPAAKRLKT